MSKAARQARPRAGGAAAGLLEGCAHQHGHVNKLMTTISKAMTPVTMTAARNTGIGVAQPSRLALLCARKSLNRLPRQTGHRGGGLSPAR
jgi:hypothetical protein